MLMVSSFEIHSPLSCYDKFKLKGQKWNTEPEEGPGYYLEPAHVMSLWNCRRRENLLLLLWAAQPGEHMGDNSE